MTIDQIPAYVLALAWIVGVLVSALKGGIEALVPAQNRWHDLLFTLLPLVLSVAAMLGYVLTHGGDRFMAVVWGVLSGCGAIGAYTVHTRTRSPATDAVALHGRRLSPTPPWVPTPAAGAPPPQAPQSPTEAPVGPTVTYSSGPPTP